MAFLRSSAGVKPFIADAALLACSVIWGSTFFIVKDVIRDMDPFVLVFYRFAVASLILGIVLWRRGDRLFDRLERGANLTVWLWIGFMSQTIGLRYTKASNAAFITSLFVLLIPFTGWLFLGQRPSLRSLFAVALAVTGLWILTGGVSEFNNGDALNLLAAASFSLHLTFACRYLLEGADPWLLCFQQFAMMALINLAIAMAWGLPMAVTSARVFAAAAYLAFFATLATGLTHLVAQRHTTLLRCSIIFALEPLFATLFAWCAGGEQFSWSVAAGGAVMIIAVVTAQLQPATMAFVNKAE